jgi:hypothetical protein
VPGPPTTRIKVPIASANAIRPRADIDYPPVTTLAFAGNAIDETGARRGPSKLGEFLGPVIDSGDEEAG